MVGLIFATRFKKSGMKFSKILIEGEGVVNKRGGKNLVG
jgi:hypothetical protein